MSIGHNKGHMGFHTQEGGDQENGINKTHSNKRLGKISRLYVQPSPGMVVFQRNKTQTRSNGKPINCTAALRGGRRVWWPHREGSKGCATKDHEARLHCFTAKQKRYL